MERLNEKVLFSQRSRTIGHHFEAIASRSVTSMRVTPLIIRLSFVDAALNSQNCLIKDAFSSESGFASLCGAIEAIFVLVLKNPCRVALRKEDLQ